MTDIIEERARAIVLANHVLDRHSADPDDDLAVLARQFLRECERRQAERADMREKAAIHVERRGTTRSGWVQNVEKVDVLAEEIRNLD